jgi:FMN phosphatase YigB (HAD superfamily)
MSLKAVLFDLDFTLWRQLGPPDYEQIQALQVQATRPLPAGSGFEQGIAELMAGYRKPHPAAMKEALRQLGVTAAEAILVGDVYEVDVLGAQRAGVRSVLKLNDVEDRTEWSADFKIRELAGLLQVIDSIRAGEILQRSTSFA